MAQMNEDQSDKKGEQKYENIGKSLTHFVLKNECSKIQKKKKN